MPNTLRALPFALALAFFSNTILASERIYLMGGFASCKYAGYPSEMKIWESLQQEIEDNGRDVEVVRSCFAVGTEPIYYDFVTYQKGQFAYSDAWSISTKQFVAEAVEASKDIKRVTFIGHSHGGDFAMNIIAASKKSVDLVVTIDPISRRDCDEWTYISSLATSTPAEGCTRFPIGEEALFSAARKNTVQWLNFYQISNTYLHSGESQQKANYDIFLPYDESVNGHTAAPHDERVWAQINENL